MLDRVSVQEVKAEALERRRHVCRSYMSSMSVQRSFLTELNIDRPNHMARES